MNNNKGQKNNVVRMTQLAAMFGLDARIALAIFGALSVITGAALYSAIGNSKATALLTELQEVGKAWEAFYLDTGHDLPVIGTTDSQKHSRDLTPLKESTEAGWGGPYLNYELESYSTKNVMNHPVYGRVFIVSVRDENTWGNDTIWNDPANTGFCDGTKQCFLWALISGVNQDIAKKVDVLVDGSDSPTTGNLKWVKLPAWPGADVFYKISPVKDPV